MIPEDGWEDAGDVQDLSPGEIHVWRSSLTPPVAALRRLAATLDREERRRADRFRDPGLGDRYRAARGVLRRLLGGYVGMDPARVRFEEGEEGKPRLAGGTGPDVRFNMTRSGGLALYAFSRSQELGVDVEEIRPVREAADIARRHFSPAERQQVASAGTDVGPAEVFLGIWTRKEAYLKALGTGLTAPLAEFDVSGGASSADETDVRRPEGGPVDGGWRTVALHVGEGHAAALAAQGPIPPVRCVDWRHRP